MALFSNGSFVADPWRRLGENEELPDRGKFILTVAQWRALAPAEAKDAADRAASNRDLGDKPEGDVSHRALGLLLEPGTEVADLASDYPHLALVAIDFPKFVDGRGYSMGRMIRERYGFTGELRATGDVLFDQLQLLARCGFNSFEIVDAPTLRLLEEGRRPGVTHFYQPGFGREVRVGPRSRVQPADASQEA